MRTGILTPYITYVVGIFVEFFVNYQHFAPAVGLISFAWSFSTKRAPDVIRATSVIVIDDTTYLACMYVYFCSDLSKSCSLLRINLPRYLINVCGEDRPDVKRYVTIVIIAIIIISVISLLLLSLLLPYALRNI